MPTFRFRAQAALQLRRREHEHAVAQRARAEAALLTAHQQFGEAARLVDDADAQLRQALLAATPRAQLEWYQSWRIRCHNERARRHEQQLSCEAALQQATAIVQNTWRRVRSLEQLQHHALAAWNAALAREERKTLDELATMRFARRKDHAS